MISSCSSTQFFSHLLAKRRFPLQGQWELTCRCNLRCVMCYTDPFNTREKIRQELTTDEALHILDEVVEAGCLGLILTGGEPLARRDFFQIYEEAHAQGLRLNILTNGTLIDEKTADRFAKNPPDRIEISLHGLTKEIFEKITQGRGSFDKCLRSIELLLERGIPLTLKATAMTLNLHEILTIKNYVQGLSKKGNVQFRLSEWMRSRLDGGADPFQFQVSEESLKELEASDPELDQAKDGMKDFLKAACYSGIHNFHIDAYGRLQLCSGNRRMSYDLRKGSFREGFYQFLPTFFCPYKMNPNLSLPSVWAVDKQLIGNKGTG